MQSERTGPTITDNARLRPLVPAERLRLTDAAIELVERWQETRLMNPLELETILQNVVVALPGEIDTEDLVRIARESATSGSPFALLLDESTVKH